MYQLLISQEPLGGFARLTDKISALGVKNPLIKSPLEDQIYPLELSCKPNGFTIEGNVSAENLTETIWTYIEE
jgi:hypothetical protein